MTVYHVLTMPSEVPTGLATAVLTGVENALLGVGANRIWIDPEVRPDIVVMAELPASTLPDGSTRILRPVRADRALD